MEQKGDSILYMIADSTNSFFPITTIKKYLNLNNANFLYDSLTKTYGEPEDFFKFHQLPDSILKKVTFLSQSLYSYLFDSCGPSPGISCSEKRWIQNFGLFSLSSQYGQQYAEKSSYLDLVSFNDQPVDSLVLAIAHKNMASILSGNQLIYTDIRNQIHWRGLSGADHLGVRLYNCSGKLIYSSSQLPATYILNTSQFPSGAYFLKYRVNNGNWRYFSFARN
jgi:hypothetical protein